MIAANAFTVLSTWLTIWFNSDIPQLRRKHEFWQHAKDGVLKELMLLAYEKRLYQLLGKSMKNNDLKDWE